ncbi:phospholipase [Neorhizobium galegae]|uniref:phospholipase n=1 Tax=Neorhizobium galegae TaxID=399 RepID=UPI000627EED2|nr:phospholipase [Neorhizobium galegae]MCM2496927.1 dienelactone hydrolase family protein [Neorhizobium galegae]MCQ1771725.1 dienelactone hydrolase family protein [Neorhizobium galegae]MCQ1778743.1 dienelactone hydrolase family protein [Neorhizobium galegae]MCQ1797283.1 dienelactone hydrolase family protein [Neorhizobium galegae]
MSTVHFVFGTVIALLSTLVTVRAEAQEGPIKPFKDELFSQMTVQKSLDGGAYEVIDYQEMRDINGRDREPERRVKDEYVSLGVRRYQQNETLDLSGRRLDVTRVGQADGAAFTVIFIHGRGGDRRLGVNDYTFGGNFNRLKNLTVGNGGTYYSPSVTSFDDKGVADIAALIRYAFDRSSGRPVILACASMGGFICQGISRDEQAVRHLKGMAQLGGPPDPDLAKSPLAKHRLPIYFAHGGSDSVYKSQDQEAVYRKLKAARYPTRFTLFATGSHGTPIRMVDWRKVLNFLLTSP